jgi:oligopeptide/dipeptide ABC transporter ATP-binding protein
MAAPLLAISDLSVSFRTETGPREVLSKISLEMAPGEILGLVGESGSGKSVTALAIMRLLGEMGRITQGSIRLADADLTRASADEMRALRGRRLAMIFQEPMTSLNPLFTIGFQIEEVLRAHLGHTGKKARARGVKLLEEVGIPGAATRYDAYPHLLSGGMRQRAMIAMAMACEPLLLIADEPTTALDVTIQAQVLALMKRLRREHGSAILLITHDMGVIARMADRVAVMYAGEVVESAPARDLFARPGHPYTRLLLAAMPTVKRKEARLPVIPGQMPAPGEAPGGCRFRNRCPAAIAVCAERAPGLSSLADKRQARCWRAAELFAEAAA